MSRKPWSFHHRMRKSGIGDAGNFHPEARRIARVRLRILKAYPEAISEKKRTKREVEAEFLALYNAGMVLPEIIKKPLHLARSTLSSWKKEYEHWGFLGLIPKYQWKWKPGADVIAIKSPSRGRWITISGPPKREAKYEFLPKLSRQWDGPVLVRALELKIFYFLPIPKHTKAKTIKRMVKGEVPHMAKPDLDPLNAFLIDCMEDIVFKSHSQIVSFSSAKSYASSPRTKIFIRALG